MKPPVIFDCTISPSQKLWLESPAATMKMDVKIDQEVDIQNDEKVPSAVVIVDEEEKVILRKIDA